MSDQNEFERLTGGAAIPGMQAVNKDGGEKRGAPIPNMQPIQGQTSTSGEQSTEPSESDQSPGQSDNKK
jgi:hypothetical protein